MIFEVFLLLALAAIAMALVCLARTIHATRRDLVDYTDLFSDQLEERVDQVTSHMQQVHRILLGGVALVGSLFVGRSLLKMRRKRLARAAKRIVRTQQMNQPVRRIHCQGHHQAAAAAAAAAIPARVIYPPPPRSVPVAPTPTTPSDYLQRYLPMATTIASLLLNRYLSSSSPIRSFFPLGSRSPSPSQSPSPCPPVRAPMACPPCPFVFPMHPVAAPVTAPVTAPVAVPVPVSSPKPVVSAPTVAVVAPIPPMPAAPPALNMNDLAKMGAMIGSMVGGGGNGIDSIRASIPMLSNMASSMGVDLSSIMALAPGLLGALAPAAPAPTAAAATTTTTTIPFPSVPPAFPEPSQPSIQRVAEPDSPSSAPVMVEDEAEDAEERATDEERNEENKANN
jgi:hypothetical protein